MESMRTVPTARQIALLHHTLGLSERNRNPYRNHFVAGPGHDDQPDLEQLVAAGLMRRARAPSFCDATDVVFWATDEGQAAALAALESPSKRSKYEQFLRADTGLTFAEWLGIDVPQRDYRQAFGPSRGIRSEVRLRTSRATGSWCPTVKEAKASYKAALAASRAFSSLK